MPYYNPIGVFDSGYGGLTILEKIVKRLSQYDFIYLGDNARAPYGSRSFEVIYAYTLQAIKKLFEFDCKLVIVACNTASAKALRNIQQKDLPLIDPTRRVLGVIRPSVEIIRKYTTTNHVAIMATKGTVNSESYVLEINKLYKEIVTVQQACPMLVPLVEYNETENPGSDYFVKKYIDELLQKDDKIDTVILACTHYPLLYKQFRKYLPSGIQIIDQGEIVSDSLADYLERHPEMEIRCSKSGNLRFLTTESSELFNKIAQSFLKKEINVEHIELR